MNMPIFSANDALNRLKLGNQRFVTGDLVQHELGQHKRQGLTTGQNPFAIVLSCADSRVVPEYIFDTGLGELFVVRVAGNIATTEAIASIEYAVAHLGCRMIVVLGHESCGAVTAACSHEDNGHNLNMLTAHIKPAVSSSEGLDETIKANAQLNACQLVNYSQIIKGAYQNNELMLAAAYYSLSTGEVNYEKVYAVKS